MTLAYHFLSDDMRSSSGNEPPCQVGEERTYEGDIVICHTGYHSSPSWYDAFCYASTNYDVGFINVACIVDVSEPVASERDKQVSRSRKLIAAKNVARELRLWACDCAERALMYERDRGYESDPRCWNAIAIARRYANGEATKKELVAASDAARAAVWGAARDAARDAAWAAEIAWQKQHLQEMLDTVFAEVTHAR